MKKMIAYAYFTMLILSCFSCKEQNNDAMERFMDILDNEAVYNMAYDDEEGEWYYLDINPLIENDTIGTNHGIEIKIKVTKQLVKN